MPRQLTLVVPGFDFETAQNYPTLARLINDAAAINDVALGDFQPAPDDYDLRVEFPGAPKFNGMPQTHEIRAAYQDGVRIMADELAALLEQELSSRRRKPIVAVLEIFEIVHTRIAHFRRMVSVCYQALADAVAAVGVENVLLVVPRRPQPIGNTRGLGKANCGGAYYVDVTGEGFDLMVATLGGQAVAVRGADVPDYVLTYEGLIRCEKLEAAAEEDDGETEEAEEHVEARFRHDYSEDDEE